MIDQKKIRNIKKNFLFQKIQEYGLNESICNSLFLSCSAGVFDNSVLFFASIIYMVQSFKIIHEIDKKESMFMDSLDYSSIDEDSDYLELKDKYNLFIKKLAKTLKLIGFDDSMDLGIYLTVMLYSGLLSSPDYFQYKKMKKDNDVCYRDILGARVLSGYGVCRNIASLFKDVYKEMGYDATYMVVKTHKHFSPSSHAVVLVSDDKGNYIIDPTWRTIGLVDDSFTRTSKLIDLDGYEIDTNYYFRQYYDDSCYTKINNDFFLSRLKNRDISAQDVSNKFQRMIRLCELIHFNSDHDEDVFFKNPNLDLIDEISDLEQKLTLVKK